MFFMGIQISFTNTKGPDIIVESGSTINQHNMTLTGLGPLNKNNLAILYVPVTCQEIAFWNYSDSMVLFLFFSLSHVRILFYSKYDRVDDTLRLANNNMDVHKPWLVCFRILDYAISILCYIVVCFFNE